jgi:DNA-directed RNA polymerase subunit RPC12/RpoP
MDTAPGESQVTGPPQQWSPAEPAPLPPAPWHTAGPPPAPVADPQPAGAPGPMPPAASGPLPPASGPAAVAVAEPTGPAVVQTDVGAKDGLAKCSRCGSTDIALNIATGHLRCNFCRFEQASPNALATYHLDGDPKLLTGLVVGSGSADIVPSTAEVLTFKCAACGAEVVIDTKSSMQARCHWCRNTLSMNQQIPNGAVPDMILPFKLSKETAVANISAFVGKRMTFAHPRFKAEFQPNNVMGVYMPYMVVDVNAKIRLTGQGEHQTRTYTEKHGDNEERYYDADVYDVARAFDIYIDDLTVESSSERLDQTPSRNSNNIINAIMPFDPAESVTYNSNYLTGFASEKRDTNVTDLAPIVTTQSQDIARYQANNTLQFYDRGVRWDDEQIALVGQRWVSAYLPVWLYSYYEKKSNGKSFVHYVAVNGRTGKTMGSVPINQLRLLLVSAVVEIIGIILGVIILVVA